MVSIIVSLEQQIPGRLDLARISMQEKVDIGCDIAAAIAGIHTTCTAVDTDVQLMVNSSGDPKARTLINDSSERKYRGYQDHGDGVRHNRPKG